jgi:hypothetical protein
MSDEPAICDKETSAKAYTDVLDDATYLGPATVLSSRGSRVRVALSDGQEVESGLALAWPTPLNQGDAVLVVGRDGSYYLIGVLEAQQKGRLRVFGDLLLHAVGGRVQLRSDKELEMRAPTVSIRAIKLHTIAESLVERASTLYQRVRDVLSVQAGEKREVVHGEWMVRADRANIMTRGTVSVNGKEVHLG